jgi:AcrR family transcriptional regulator
MTLDIDHNPHIDDLVLPEWHGTNTKGRATRELILRTALSVLVDEGYGAMSMRRVASMAGLQFGNLTYHYPSRDELVTELLDSVIKAYECAYDEMLKASKYNGWERLALYIKLAFVSMQHANQARFAPEIWALSNHEPVAETRMYEMYVRAMRLIENILIELRPDLAPDHVRALALYCLCSTEGFVVFIGADKPFQAWRPAMERLAVKSMIDLMSTVEPGLIGHLPALPSRIFAEAIPA